MEVSALMQTSVMLLCGGQGGCESAALQSEDFRQTLAHCIDLCAVINLTAKLSYHPLLLNLLTPLDCPYPSLPVVYSLRSRVKLCKKAKG